MKIRIELWDPEDITPESVAAFEEQGIRRTEQYIEMDTGGEFGDLPPQELEYVKEALGITLQGYARKIVALMRVDCSLRKQGYKEQPGVEILNAGLDELNDALKAVVDNMESMPDFVPDMLEDLDLKDIGPP